MYHLVVALLQLTIDIYVLNVELSQVLEDLIVHPGLDQLWIRIRCCAGLPPGRLRSSQRVRARLSPKQMPNTRSYLLLQVVHDVCKLQIVCPIR